MTHNRWEGKKNICLDAYNKGSHVQRYLLPCLLSILCFSLGHCTSQTFLITHVTKNLAPSCHPLQFSSDTQSLTLCDPMDCSTPGFPVHHQLLELTQTHVHQVGDAIQPSHPLSSPSPPTFYLSKHQGLFQWVSSSHQVAKVLEFQLQHQSFQRIFRTDFL